MKNSCKVIQDILPLYAEKMTSDESNKLVEEHIANCSKCAKILESIKLDTCKSGVKTGSSASLKFVQESIKKRRAKAIVFASLVVFLVMFMIFSYLTEPRYISFKDSDIKISELENREVYANFSDKVTSYKIEKYTVDNQLELQIEAWTSGWDKLLGKSTPSVLISDLNSKADRVYYCDYTTENNNMTIVYGVDPYTHGGVIVLPRLVLGYYFMMAAVALIIIGIVWVLLRNRPKVNKVCKYLFFVPVSFLLSYLLLKIGFVSFSAMRDFIMSLIASIAIYGISILGISLIKQHKADKT